MKLFLHSGTEKTGSSFLQMLAARNRATLVRCNIYFPKGGKREGDMLKGRVSPGNGKALYDALRKKSASDARNILVKAIEEARLAGCGTLLISNENMVELFSVEGAMPLLESLARELGVTETHALLVLREPVDQALSLYKHRAKSGAAARIEHWMEHDFHTMKALTTFLRHKDETSIRWTVRKYHKSPQKMREYFFNDWLAVTEPIAFDEMIVNPSLTLSELMFLKIQRRINADLVPHYYDALLSLGKHLKAGDQHLESLYKASISEALSRQSGVINELNALLPADEKLELPQMRNGRTEVPENLPLALSEHQLDVIARTQHRLYSVKGHFKSFAAGLKKKTISLIRR